MFPKKCSVSQQNINYVEFSTAAFEILMGYLFFKFTTQALTHTKYCFFQLDSKQNSNFSRLILAQSKHAIAKCHIGACNLQLHQALFFVCAIKVHQKTASLNSFKEISRTDLKKKTYEMKLETVLCLYFKTFISLTSSSEQKIKMKQISAVNEQEVHG